MTVGVMDYSRYPQVSGELFRAVHELGLFDDSKSFVDAVPRVDSDVVVERYLARRDDPVFDLATFVDEHFHLPEPIEVEVPEDEPLSLAAFIDRRWETLTRTFDADPNACGTLLPLPNPHVVPGGRFREMYYWDSYFIAEGLAATGHLDVVEGMVENLGALIDRHGFVPLGNRVYYDSRSQVPLFYRMLRVLEREWGVDGVEPHLPLLELEYEFWMDGVGTVSGEGDREAHQRVVGLPCGGVANRYWDTRARPRPEAYREDRELAAGVPTDCRPGLFRDVRAACESGWDFSSRWLRDVDDPTSLWTTDLVPVDLNAVLFELESSLAEWSAATGDEATAEYYEAAAADRRAVVERYCWDDERSFYVDYRWPDDEPSPHLTLAGVVPLFTGLASDDRAAAVARRLREDFLHDGGLVTTLQATGHQWDHPNGWAPLHWMAVVGLKRYGHDDLADEVASRWIGLNRSVYETTGDVAEKYDVVAGAPADDRGEYVLQYGFGWTNGVVLALEALSPDRVREPSQ